MTVHGKPTASGVKGKLGTFKRDGFTQVTLNGDPLYTFEGDGNKAGVANGNGIVAFGGTWHVVVAGSAKAAQAPSRRWRWRRLVGGSHHAGRAGDRFRRAPRRDRAGPSAVIGPPGRRG